MTQEKKHNSRSKDQEKSKKGSEKSKEKKDKDAPPTKVIIRRLPPSLTQETFLEQVSPVPEHDYLYFIKGDLRLGSNAFSRAYINFLNMDDILIFREKFDGYVFVDAKGNEYTAIVEFAPYQKIPKKKAKKPDSKKNTVEQDSEYLKFLDFLKDSGDAPLPTPEAYLEEIEAKERELKANNGVLKMSTPLLDYLKRKKEEKKAFTLKMREEKKRRELERKKQREEERKKRKDKERERQRDRDAQRHKERGEQERREREKDDNVPAIKLLKNPEAEAKEQAQGVKDTGVKDKWSSKDKTKLTRERERARDKTTWGVRREKTWDKDKKHDREEFGSKEKPEDSRQSQKQGGQREQEQGKVKPDRSRYRGDRDRDMDRPKDRGKDGQKEGDRGKEEAKVQDGHKSEKQRDQGKRGGRENNEQWEKDRGKKGVGYGNSDRDSRLSQKYHEKEMRSSEKELDKDRISERDRDRRKERDFETWSGKKRDQTCAKDSETERGKKSGRKGDGNRAGGSKEKEAIASESKDEKTVTGTSSDKAGDSRAGSVTSEGSEGGAKESSGESGKDGTAKSRQRVRYKDRPERAIYNPAKRAAERRKEAEARAKGDTEKDSG